LRTSTESRRKDEASAADFVLRFTEIAHAAGYPSGWLRRSALTFIVPGVLILVPGSAGFNS